MTSTPASPVLRTARAVLGTTLRAAVLITVAEFAPVLSGNENDALAGGLMAMFSLSAAAFVIAVLDGILQRDRLRLGVLWGVVTLVVAVYQIGADLWRTTHGPGAYPNLQIALTVERGDLPSTFVFFALFVAVPAAAGIGLGMVCRLSTQPPSRRLDERAPTGTSGGVR